ncbi:MAG: RpiB/LacA/LacB family sugar-phosphate isomerase [Defluviitaleaceae bacterium]|nr:RpiB/LacA/LacB family sugar-phosphate isomerase [Defluviitaleaceae bacterium]
MKIIIGSDKSGFTLKEFIKSTLPELGFDVEDIGTTDVDLPRPFMTVAPIAAQMIQENKAHRAILICGTGMGMSQVANKFHGVFAACCESLYSARMCRAINNSNVLCLGGWVTGNEMGLEMAKAFLTTEHTEGLEEWRQEFLKKALVTVREIDDAQRKQVQI